MPQTICLIGPMATGKSTIAEELSKIVNLPRVPMDKVRYYYYFKQGYSLETERQLETFEKKVEYWKPFELLAVKEILKDFPDSIIDFGAGLSYYPKEEHLNEAKNFLIEYQNIFLLLPSIDKEKSLEICNNRLKIRKGSELDENDINANREFIYHESNYKLSKHIIYTKDREPKDIALEIKSKIK